MANPRMLIIKRDRRTAVPQAADLIFATGFGTFGPWPGHLAMTKRKSSEERDFRPEGADAADEVGALVPGEPVIEQDRVERGFLRILQHELRRLEIRGAAHPPACARADRADEPPLRGLVVNQQQATIWIRPHSRPSRFGTCGIPQMGKGGLKGAAPSGVCAVDNFPAFPPLFPLAREPSNRRIRAHGQ